jgi:hypothetical protein
MRANYPRSHTGKKKNMVLARYINEYIALCIVYGVDRANEILQERHEGSKNNADGN